MVFWLAALALLLPGKSRALAERFDANPRANKDWPKFERLEG
jgi:hypothetical protein